MSTRAGRIKIQVAANVEIPDTADFVILYVDSVTGNLDYRKSDGAVVSTTHD